MKASNKSKIVFTIPLIIVTIIAFFFRFVLLDRIPTGISNDEIFSVTNAKAFFLTGKTVVDKHAELEHIITSPIIGFFPASLFISRLPYAVFSVLLVVLLYLITQRLVGRNEAIFVGIAAAVNPWGIMFGRTAYEAPIAIFFYLLSFYILLIAKGWKILLTFLPLFIGFNSYIGFKIILLPFVLIITVFTWLVINKKSYLAQYLILLTLCVMLFIFSTMKSSLVGSRFNEIIPVARISSLVDTERRLSIQTPLTYFFSNKPVVLFKEYLGKYLGVFSPNLLFLYGEGKQHFSLWFHGYFYYLDILFLIIGMIALYKKKRSLWLLLLGLVLIAPIPSALRSDVDYTSYVFRSVLIFPIFVILVGIGISYVVFLGRSKTYKVIILTALLFIYGLLVLNFSNIYFFRNPIYNSEAYDFGKRLLSKYAALSLNTENKVVVISESEEPHILFQNFLIYTNSFNSENGGKISQIFASNNFDFGNIKFTRCPKDITSLRDNILVIAHDAGCNLDEKRLTIPQLSDGGTLYNIYNDRTCSRYQLGKYPKSIKLDDFNVENLSEKNFCERFITNLQMS